MKSNIYHTFRVNFKDELGLFLINLKEKGFKLSTIGQHLNYISQFLNYISEKNINIYKCSYKDLLNYIKIQKKTSSLNNINRKLTSIRYYYNFLNVKSNPAEDIVLRGKRNKLITGTLLKSELEHIYNEYLVKDIRTKRNKIILNLLIKQGLKSSEIEYLTLEDVDLKNGKISLQNRVLNLEACQILELYEYISIYRKKIKNSFTTNSFFLSINGGKHIKASLEHLFKFLHKKNRKIKSSSQLRQSIITHWLKIYDIRKVQYMAGHKCISTTERYKYNSIDSLQEALNKFHAFNL